MKHCARIPQYRAWDKKKNQMVTFGRNIPICKAIYCYMQQIGLKDKNGKEVYEGDIIECGGSMHIVSYGVQCLDAFVCMGFSPSSFYDAVDGKYRPNTSRLSSEISVIGNVFENKDWAETAERNARNWDWA